MLEFAGIDPNQPMIVEFDFNQLKNAHFMIKLDVGASSYWSEIAAMQTLDGLLQNQLITLEDYLERVPDGYVLKRQELLEKIRGQNMQAQPMHQTGATPIAGSPQAQAMPEGGGYSALQRKINETGEVPRTA